MPDALLAGPPPSSTHPDPAVQLLLDRQAIVDLFHAYAAGVDRRDFDLVASCFAEDVHGAFGGTERAGRDALVEYVAGVRFFHTTMHMLGNTLIDVDGDRARLDADAMIKHRGTLRDGRDFQMNMSASRYGERLERREGAWKIVERAVEPVWAPTGVTRAASRDDAVQWLLDRAEIHDLLARYAVGVDARSWALVRACFAEELDADYLGHTFDEPEPLMEFIRGVEVFGWTRHFFGRARLDVGSDEAASDALALITSRTKDDPEGKRERTTAAHYRDDWVRERGRWRVYRRRHGAKTPPLERRFERPGSTDPTVAWLLDRATISDCISDYAANLDRTEGAHHHVGNQLARIDGGEALTETYVYRIEPLDGGAQTPWHENAQRWEDRLVREHGAWRLADHRVRTNEVGAA